MRETMALPMLCGGGVDLAQHAVHAKAHREAALEGLDVDVGRARMDGILDELIDEADNGRAKRHVAEIVDVFAFRFGRGGVGPDARDVALADGSSRSPTGCLRGRRAAR